ncbi:MAG: hypothetical protein KJ804_10360 [Proteobacteria bacterium]|nr:hypothetical protein [Pseudomonadota bacterium]MBU1058704.1 hypothetical protein [Pseudomonadota bacterium]
MPYPGRLGRGKEMGRGPYEKSGLLRETSIPPLARVHKTFEITYPFKDVKKGTASRRELLEDELTVSVVLWYLPFGEFDGNETVFFEQEKDLDLKTEWIWR